MGVDAAAWRTTTISDVIKGKWIIAASWFLFSVIVVYFADWDGPFQSQVAGCHMSWVQEPHEEKRVSTWLADEYKVTYLSWDGKKSLTKNTISERRQDGGI